MNDTIDQFMWGFQRHFRIVVALGIERALAAIGLPVRPHVLLVGYAIESDLAHRVCVEPEDGAVTVENLTAVAARAKELFEESPDSSVFVSDARLHDLRRRQLFQRSRGDALVEAIDASGAFGALTFFASNGAPIDGYHVHTCLGIPTAALESLPTLDDSVVDRVHVGRSLQHEVVSECLYRADRALYLPDPGADLFPLGLEEDIVRAAAARLVEGAEYRATNRPVGLLSRVNAFTSLGYERTAAGGRLVIARREKTADRLRVRLQRPVPLRQARSIRKLLELSDDSNAVLADHEGVYGLGACVSALDVVEISVTGHAEWELSVDKTPLVRVSYGQPTLPQPLLDGDEFVETAQRVLGDADTDRIWEIIQGIQGTGHGTTLVVSSEPEAETARLGAEAVPIEPVFLETADIVRFGRVDGAVLLGPDGRCHAFGVILDGEATGRGDPARGSRFNSAVRYQSTMASGSVIVVISDDGIVDLIPRLRPQVRRDDVEAAVRAFRECCETEYVDGEEFSRTYERLKSFAFYLDDAQCGVVNECYENEMLRRFEAGGIRLYETPLRPHPDMDESYFV